MTFAEWIGLILTVVCVLIALAALIVDAARIWILGIPTFSEIIWAKFADWKNGRGSFPIWGIILPAWFLLGCIGLAIHFFM